MRFRTVPPLLELSAVSRLPSPGDNVGIATRRIEAGETVTLGGAPRTLRHTILEGHRFAVLPILQGAELLSWGLPFGVALADIAPGDYVCNRFTLEALAERNLPGAVLPAQPNFENRIVPFTFDEASFHPAKQVDPAPDAASRTFLGFQRGRGRGVGTRNTIVILGTSSRTASWARQLARRLEPLADAHSSLDGIVAIAHTEGDGPERINNRSELLRALAGFMVHPNVGAILAVDSGDEAVGNAELRRFMEENGYPLGAVPHRFLTLGGPLEDALTEGETIVREWIPAVSAQRRQLVPLSGLRIGLQCGGSDAFSGVSANPLIGRVARELIRCGGAVNLAETDELVGAESHILARVSDLETARRFLAAIARFKERLRWHGATAEGNPTAGNRFRGLYNIVLKSLGAAMKKDPELRLDRVIDYAEPMRLPGFFFMDSPGNDLESVAGQVAAGCNVILFTTGNGSITNFPFVPTIKVTSTTRRHELLKAEMDVNAGAYLDGVPMDTLTQETFERVCKVAGGLRTRGELAGHSQVSIWRNWRQSDASRLALIRSLPVPDGRPLPLAQPGPKVPDLAFPAFPVAGDPAAWACDRVGLIIPASLCSGQVARLAAERLTRLGIGRDRGITRFVALTHTEGCGFAGENLYVMLPRTFHGYAVHRCVAAALFLEHGCEKIPNDVMRRRLVSRGAEPARFGWASVQLDGGIDPVLAKIEAWFATRLALLPATARQPAGLSALSLGLMSSDCVAPETADAFSALARVVVAAGGSVLVSESDALLRAGVFRERVLGGLSPRATLAYGEPLALPGFHVVSTESEHWVENLTGLGGCGAQLVLACVGGQARQGHPFVHLIQVAQAGGKGQIPSKDIDGVLSGDPGADYASLLRLVLDTAGGQRASVASAHGFVDFQLTRGLLGVST